MFVGNWKKKPVIRPGRSKKFFSFYTSPGYSDELLHLFLGKDLEFKGKKPDPDELLATEIIERQQIEELLFTGKVKDSKTIIGLLYFFKRGFFMLKEYFGDFHIHIGQAQSGSPVKITASRKLNFASIARESLERKGLDLVGIIDCASPPVIADIENLLVSGEMTELSAGGICYQNQLVIIPGAEVASKEVNGGQAHYLAYFPFLEVLKEFSLIMKQYISNINLSSQVTGLTGKEILQIVDGLGGLLVPAHVFTPHKSFYGRCFNSYQEVFF